MTSNGFTSNSRNQGQRRRLNSALPVASMLLILSPSLAAQSTPSKETTHPDVAAELQMLTTEMRQMQAQIEQSQHQLQALRDQVTALQAQLTEHSSASAAASGSQEQASAEGTPQSANVQDIREHQDVEDAEIATHEQIKVESVSKYPLALTGLVLFNGFVNTDAVDSPAVPTVATYGSGSTGASVRQTILGFNARGPHLWGASSSADLRVDFWGSAQPAVNSALPGYSYNNDGTLVRLRTAHARLNWNHAEAYFALDRPLISPDSPASLTAVAEPALAWSGSLWMWGPQVGVVREVALPQSTSLCLQAALMDVADAPLTPASSNVTSSESGRRPGVEARIALLGKSSDEDASHFGIGGYFAPHLSPFGRHYDAWAATIDMHLRMPAGFSLTGSAYRGLALGGLGGGAYKDIAYKAMPTGLGYYARPMSDVGGWAQLQEKFSERVQLNAAFGTDQLFARELVRYETPTNTYLQNLARNMTWTGNVIYSPSAYLLFSFEYRHLKSAAVGEEGAESNIFGAAAGYRF